MFHIADANEIKEGKMTDVYFVRTMEVLRAKKSRLGELLPTLIEKQKILGSQPGPKAIRNYVIQQLPHFEL